MDSMILGWSFATAVIIAACVTYFFNDSIDEALGLVVPPEMGSSWRRYAKFGLFVVTLAGGMRVSELTAFVAARAAGSAPLTPGQGLMEVLKSVAGSLTAAAIGLLVFFAAALAIDASRRVYQNRRIARPLPPAETDRRQVGSERHAAAGAKERRENGSYL